jgi:hypothetical protein
MSFRDVSRGFVDRHLGHANIAIHGSTRNITNTCLVGGLSSLLKLRREDKKLRCFVFMVINFPTDSSNGEEAEVIVVLGAIEGIDVE